MIRKWPPVGHYQTRTLEARGCYVNAAGAYLLPAFTKSLNMNLGFRKRALEKRPVSDKDLLKFTK